MTAVTLAEAVDLVAAADPVLARLVQAVGPIRDRPRDPDGHFGALVRAIVFQQLAGRAAIAIHGRVRALVDGSYPRRFSPPPMKTSGRPGCPPPSSLRYGTCRPEFSTARSCCAVSRASRTKKSSPV